MRLIYNEFSKLIRVKSIWVIYIIGMIIVLIAMNNEYTKPWTDIHVKFIDIHGVGPYDKELISNYAEINSVTRECSFEFKYNEENFNNCVDSQLSEQQKGILSLYPDHDYLGRWANGFFDTSTSGFYNVNVKIQNYEDTLSVYEETKSNELTGLEEVEKYFIKNMLHKRVEIFKDYDTNNGFHVFMHDMIHEETFEEPIFFLSLISMLMLVLSTALLFSNDSMYNVDYLILTSKKGRKIIKSKFIAVSIAAVFYSSIVFIPWVLSYLYKTKLYLLINNPMNAINSYYLYWFDLSIISTFMLLFLLIVVSHLFIGLITSAIAIYSKKMLNIITYLFIITTVVIVGITFYEINGATTLSDQITNVILLHTPFGFIRENMDMLRFGGAPTRNSNFTYQYFSLVYPFINTVLISLLCFKAIKHYYKQNL